MQKHGILEDIISSNVSQDVFLGENMYCVLIYFEIISFIHDKMCLIYELIIIIMNFDKNQFDKNNGMSNLVKKNIERRQFYLC